jgi:APA family basic amino acid/polyamine antiporter
MTAVAVFAIYLTLPAIALSALPVRLVDGEFATLLGLPPEEGGFANDPILGVIENLGVSGALLDGLRIYVGILAATILFIATNAGVIGASRITYAMAGYRQLPELFRRVHPRFKTPWISLVVFAGLVSIVTLLPGQVDFLGTMYSFGAMLSFTIAHVSIVALRYRRREEELVFRGRPNLRVGGVDWPLFAFVGAVATGLAWLVVVVQSASTRWAGLGWLAAGFIMYALYRRRFVHASMMETVRAPALVLGPALALEYRSIVVPVTRSPESEEALVAAARLAAERRATIAIVHVLEVPLSLPLNAALPEEEEAANELLDEARALVESYGVRAVVRLARARRAGPAIVEEAVRRNAELIIVGAPRRLGRRGPVFGKTVDYVLKASPVRVLVAAGKQAA